MALLTWLYCLSGSVFVMMSRLYLGVHSPADIVVGGIIGCIVLSIWMKTDDLFDIAVSYGTNGKLYPMLSVQGLQSTLKRKK